MSDNDSVSSASDDVEELVCTIDDKEVTKTQLIRWLHSTNRKDKKALNTFITQAILYDITEVFKVLFDNGYQIDVMNSQRQTVVHLAFYDESCRVNERHQMQSPDRSPTDFRYNPNETTNLLVKKWLLKQPNTLNCTDIHGLNYLHIACFMGNFKVVKKYLNSNYLNAHFCHPENMYNNFTPLHFAVINDSADAVSIVNHLLEHGANVDATDSKGRTPLHLACSLFLNPRKFDSSNLVGGTSDRQVAFKQLSVCLSKNIAILKALLKHHSNVEFKDKYDNTPLLSIFPDNYHELSRFKKYWHYDEYLPMEETITKFAILLKAGADIIAVNKRGDTILHLVIKSLELWRDDTLYGRQSEFNDFYHAILVEQTVKLNKFVVNSVNKNGETALQLALNYFSYDIVELLLNYGADVSYLKILWENSKLFDHIKFTPHFDIVRNFIAIIDLFNIKNYDMSPLAQLAVLEFLTHKRENCTCDDDPHDLLHFGSTTHVVRILTEMYNETGPIDLNTNCIDSYLDSMRFGGFYIDQEVKSALTNFGEETDANSFESLKDNLIKDINIMKSTNLQNCRSLFDVMAKHPHDVPQCFMSDFDFDVLNKFTSGCSNIVSGHLTKVMIRQHILKYGIDSLEYLCPMLPDLCLHAIMSYLSNADIVNVFSATTTIDANQTRFFV